MMLRDEQTSETKVDGLVEVQLKDKNRNQK